MDMEEPRRGLRFGDLGAGEPGWTRDAQVVILVLRDMINSAQHVYLSATHVKALNSREQ
jgi:hypothetical protein